MAGPAIAVRHVTKRYGATLALDRATLRVASGAAVVLLGPSGSGKTTLLRIIAGLDAPESGEVRLGGVTVSRRGLLVPPHRRGIGFVFQSGALWPHMTVAQNIEFGLHGLGRPAARARTSDLLARMGLGDLHGRYPDQLSAGQLRRVALARALAPEPRILLLDEPLTNVEPELKDTLVELILETAGATGATVVHVTHDADEARCIASRLVMVRGGRVVDACPRPR